jgi:hypothetical protein
MELDVYINRGTTPRFRFLLSFPLYSSCAYMDRNMCLLPHVSPYREQYHNFSGVTHFYTYILTISP